MCQFRMSGFAEAVIYQVALYGQERPVRNPWRQPSERLPSFRTQPESQFTLLGLRCRSSPFHRMAALLVLRLSLNQPT